MYTREFEVGLFEDKDRGELEVESLENNKKRELEIGS